MALFEGTGDISNVVADFQAALGEPNNGNAAGPIPEGRRQINWDAGIVPFDMPGDFFNKTVTRGVELSTGVGSEFRVSNPDPTDPGAPDNRFDSINPTYAGQFTTFSDFRLFTPEDSNTMEIKFFVSGTDIPATVNGFGAVFTDVDLSDSTKIDYYDIHGNLLESEYVDPDPQGLSFLGATFKDQELYRVEITSGNTTIGPDDDPANGIDIVVMDDFLFGEPKVAAPELGSNDDDVLLGTPDGDFIDALGGDDTVLLFGGNDFAKGGKGNDLISGGDGDDIIRGREGNDTLIGDKGDDVKNGGDGDDLIIWNNGDGSDTIDGGSGHDVVEVNGAPRDGDQFRVTALDEVGKDGDNRAFFERVNLGRFNLNIDTVETLKVNSGGGDDEFIVEDLSATSLELVAFDGGIGADTLDGAQSETAIFGAGGAGDDSLVGGSADDTIRGGAGDDFISGGNGSDYLLGNGGDDTLQGGNGSDITNGGGGIDTASFTDIPFAITADLSRGFAVYEVAPGTRVFDHLINIENLSGSQLDDIFRGDNKSNVLTGNDGDDKLIARKGNDTLIGGSGDDALLGSSGHDQLTGNSGDDILMGGSGADRFNGGAGNDIMRGGAGRDTFIFDETLLDGQSDIDFVRGFQAHDELDFSAYLGAGGTLEVDRLTGGVLRIELSGEDTVNIVGSGAALNALETQFATL